MALDKVLLYGPRGGLFLISFRDTPEAAVERFGTASQSPVRNLDLDSLLANTKSRSGYPCTGESTWVTSRRFFNIGQTRIIQVRCGTCQVLAPDKISICRRCDTISRVTALLHQTGCVHHPPRVCPTPIAAPTSTCRAPTILVQHLQVLVGV